MAAADSASEYFLPLERLLIPESNDGALNPTNFRDLNGGDVGGLPRLSVSRELLLDLPLPLMNIAAGGVRRERGVE